MLNRKILLLAVAAVAIVGVLTALATTGDKTYKMTATAIEGCSCPLFCSCYYNAEPTGGHKCEFALVYRFDEGSHWGDVDVSGATIWVSGDLGDHFGQGETDWAVVTFDKAVTADQRMAIDGWIKRVFPVTWAGGVTVREDDITWENGEKVAHAKMASGMAEIKLEKVFDAHGHQSIVSNTAYWATDSNNGFELAYATHHYDGEPKSYKYEKRNGFTITSVVEGTIE